MLSPIIRVSVLSRACASRCAFAATSRSISAIATQPRTSETTPIVKTFEIKTLKPVIDRSQALVPVDVPVPKPTPEVYTVTRTPSKSLPVYQLRKGNGTLKLTRVRKIGGDRETLRVQLEKNLEPKPEYVKINQLTGNIILKGWYKTQIDLFLKEKGF